MARGFPLAGLLRLRRLQEDQAASQLASANGRVRDNNTIQTRARRTLEGFTSTPTDVDTLRAIAAARASSSSMLADLVALDAMHRQHAQRAEADFHLAKLQSVSIEKLNDKHAEAASAEDLRVEQLALDEIASSSWQRRTSERRVGESRTSEPRANGNRAGGAADATR
jgi:flagellar FliJ protein